MSHLELLQFYRFITDAQAVCPSKVVKELLHETDFLDIKKPAGGGGVSYIVNTV